MEPVPNRAPRPNKSGTMAGSFRSSQIAGAQMASYAKKVGWDPGYVSKAKRGNNSEPIESWVRDSSHPQGGYYDFNAQGAEDHWLDKAESRNQGTGTKTDFTRKGPAKVSKGFKRKKK
jgi:hypothetical protein